MKIRDGRKLTLGQKELLRKQAIYFVIERGMSRVSAADYSWCL